ncbi:PREDICTED: uncharacterized protein LOC106741587 [Dinoponera quadriceps]|uniref:Uncharacterized protein LOC106741587 n=1 Tax=Dinoponera quadriceps TaxID=609295 RepID=A0A6P3WTP7_DINQU|nr:PREDICTED: uncharacterized protein LOC106741587 [Dinoponera quadriceps]
MQFDGEPADERMGIKGSKIKVGSRGKNGGSKGTDTPGSQANVYESVELMMLRRSLKKDPEGFILNNLMMSVQFFENYEESIIRIQETLASSSEAKLNKKLPPQKHVLMPDVLQEYVSRNVAFTSMRQTSRHTIEPLHPIRIYVVHDNIELTEQHYLPEYSSVNNEITYNVLMKPSEQQGYVRLELLDETPLPKNPKKEDHDPSAEDEDEIYSDGGSIYVPKPSSKMVLSQQMKKGNLQTSNARSLPNLHNETVYEDQAYHSRENLYETQSSRDIRPESDYEHVSPVPDRMKKKAWSKDELASKSGSYHVRPGMTESKKNSRSPAGSTTSGYRSGYYTVDSDSDSSCHITQSTNAMLSPNTNSNAASTCNFPDGYSEKAVPDASTEIYSMSNAKIPQRCFKKVMHTREGKIYDPREEKKQLQNSKQRRLRMAMRRRNYEVSYISSTEFMRHFVNIFKNQLGQLLDFGQEDLDEVKPEGSVIYCDKIMVSHSSRLCRIESYEVTPTIWLQWPEYAQEWLDRPRSTWPSYEDISKVKDFGCYVVPEGFLPKKGSNAYHDLEWQLVFPAAERYLETCMTRSQAQVYLIALMLHKSFIMPVFDTMFGLTTSHIRNKMFWLIEEDDRPSRWPDNQTGQGLMKLLNSLYRSLSQNEPTLPDYFIRDKNVFQRVPSDHLLHTQKQLKRIIENPVMYVFHAMENIRHSEKFFPRLDYEMLLKILTMDTLTLVNPALGQSMFTSSSSPNDESHLARDEIYNKPGGFWDNAKLQTEKKIYARVVTNRTLINPRRATDSIIEISVRCANLEGPRLGALLDFFVRHFIKMAACCHQYQAYQQKKVYLDQADWLSIILSDQSRYKEDARAYRDKINALRARTASSRPQANERPETPKRNGEAPLFVGTLKDRFIRETTEVTIESGEEQPQSSREDRRDKVGKTVNKSVFYEVRFEADEDQEQQQAKPTKPSEVKRNEIISILKNSKSREQNDESASGTSQKVVSLADNKNESFLTETTYI